MYRHSHSAGEAGRYSTRDRGHAHQRDAPPIKFTCARTALLAACSDALRSR